ncbi:MAG: voltage-gated sodium channel [Motiliproteus sp.]|jgi:voltage-gated sodium channel
MNTRSLQQRFLHLRSNKVFELFVIAVIIGSALLVGVKTYELHPLAQTAAIWLDRLITVIFLTEILIRFIGEEHKGDFFKNPWNLFDTLIVTISLIPIDNTDMALVARLVRVFRVLRMVSIIPELRMLLNSLVKALPQLGYVLLLMFIIFYIYAAVGSTLFEEINPTLWGDVSISLLTLFRIMTFEDWTDVMYETMAVYPLSWSYYLSFIFFTAFAFLNMVIGIVVNVMNDEHNKILKQKAIEAHEPTIQDIYHKLEAMEARLLENSSKARP